MSNLVVEIGNTALKAAWSDRMTLGKTFRYQGEKVTDFILSLTTREKPAVMVVSSVYPLSEADIQRLRPECGKLVVLDKNNKEFILSQGLPTYLSYDRAASVVAVRYLFKGRGCTIHKADCPNIMRIRNTERLINVSWGEPKQVYSVPITIKAYDRQGLINDITNLLLGESVNLENINVKTTHNFVNIEIVVDVQDITQLSRLLNKMEALPNVIEAYRKKPG